MYSLVKSLIAPTKPEEKSYQELIDVVKDHLQPKPLVVAERYKFHQRSQREEESVSQFMAAIRKLSEHCEFGTFLNDAIRDRFVCGLHSRNIQEKLLTESNLTAKKALEVATSMEAAGKQSLQFHETPRVQRVEVSKRQGRCYRCGKSNHLSDACFYASAKCHVCREPGHIRKMCPKLQAGRNRGKRDKGRLANTEKRKEKPSCVNCVYSKDETEEHSLSGDELPVYTLNSVGSASLKPGSEGFALKVKLDGRSTSMILDTGAAVCIMPERLYLSLWKSKPLEKPDLRLKACGGQSLTILGKATVVVEHEGQRAILPLYVLKIDGPALFGRNWLSQIRLNWENIGFVSKETTQRDLERLLESSQAFKPGLGKVKNVKAHLQVKPNAMPKFYKARTVAFSCREKVEQELERLQKEGIL